MRELDYTDGEGRRWRVALPDGAPDEEAAQGIIVGPPPVADALGIAEPWATRLHNELHRRGLYRLVDVRRRPGDVQGALQAMLKLDAQAIMTQYELLERQ